MRKEVKPHRFFDNRTIKYPIDILTTHQETHRPITPISPIPSPTVPFCLPILSLNTSTRHLITKEGTPPFTLTFNPGTRHYDLMDQSTHTPSYFLHTFHPLNLKIAAWAPGSLQVHTQTKDYVKKNGTGEFMNWGVQDVEGLEMLVEELKGSGVEVLRMELWVFLLFRPSFSDMLIFWVSTVEIIYI